MKLTYPELNIILNMLSDYVDAVSKQSAACKIVGLNFEMDQSVGLTPIDVQEAIKHRTNLLVKHASITTSAEDFTACNDLLDLIRDDYIEDRAYEQFVNLTQQNEHNKENNIGA